MLGATLFLPSDTPVPSFGLYAQFEDSPDGPALGPFDHAILHACRGCGATSFHHASGDWRCAVAGCADGNSLVDIIDASTLRRWWAEAGNKVQWKRPVDDLPPEVTR